MALVAYGLGVGIGVACAYVPMVALVGGWFELRRTLALGVAVAGIGLGTLIVPPATAALIEAAGWRDAYLVLGIGGAAALRCARWRSRPRRGAGAAGGTRVAEAARDPELPLALPRAVLVSVALFVPFVHLPAYAEERGVDPVAAAGLIGAIGVASVAGRLALGALAGGAGLLRVFQGCFAAMGLSFALWAVAGGSYAVMLAFAAVLGVGYGGFVALAPAVVAARFGSPTSARARACSTPGRGSARRSGRRWRARSSTPRATGRRSPARWWSGSRRSPRSCPCGCRASGRRPRRGVAGSARSRDRPPAGTFPDTMTRARTRIPCAIIVIATSA